MSNPVAIDFNAAQAGYHENAAARRQAREALVDHLKAKAHADHDYRKALSVAMARYRIEGQSVGEAEIHAKAAAARHALDRDVADAEAKGVQARLAELEGERASLRQLADWSREEAG